MSTTTSYLRKLYENATKGQAFIERWPLFAKLRRRIVHDTL